VRRYNELIEVTEATFYFFTKTFVEQSDEDEDKPFQDQKELK